MKKKINRAEFTKEERALYRRLSSPAKVQDYLDTLEINFEMEGLTLRSPRQVLRQKSAQCLEGAIFAACALSQHGYKPLILDLIAYEPDVSHNVAVFQGRGFWGAISKTNHVVLRYRETVYKSIRELVMSYFHEYFLDSGDKTLCQYSRPVNLTRFDSQGWQTAENDLWYINEYLDQVPHYDILQPWQARQLRKASGIEIEAGKLVEWGNTKRF